MGGQAWRKKMQWCVLKVMLVTAIVRVTMTMTMTVKVVRMTM